MTFLEAGEHIKELITTIRRLKLKAGYKQNNIVDVWIVTDKEDNIYLYTIMKAVINRMCKINLIIAPVAHSD